MTRAAVIHLITEFVPLVTFFIAGQLFSFFAATLILLILTVGSLLLSWRYERRVALMPLIASAFVVVPGYMTLHFHNEDILIFADTLFYFLIAVGVGFGLLANKLVLKTVFEATFAMTNAGWRVLSYRWIVVLLLAGIGNEFVRLNFTPEVWVDYKFVKVIMILLFALYQFTLAKKYRLKEESNSWGLRLQPLHSHQPKLRALD